MNSARSGIDDVEQELKSGVDGRGSRNGNWKPRKKTKEAKESTQGTRPTASTSRTEQWFKDRPEKGEMGRRREEEKGAESIGGVFGTRAQGNFEPLDVNLQGLTCLFPLLSSIYSTSTIYVTLCMHTVNYYDYCSHYE